MDFIELTHSGNKKKISIRISKIEAIFEVEHSKYTYPTHDYATRIILSCNEYFDVDESYETVMEMVNR